MLRIVVATTASGRALCAVPAAEIEPRSSQLLVEVRSISLNRGEVSAALERAQDGWAPGWDFAGVVSRGAADGSGPKPGARVVGMLGSGSWAECIAVEAASVAVVPDGIELDVAATLPIAGLTALYALEKAGSVAGKHVLITGATGGMGQFAVQLALLAGASVTAAVHRNPSRAAPGVRVVEMDKSGLVALRERRYDLVIDGVGGDVFTAALESLAPGGTLIALGATRDVRASFDIRKFFNTGRASIYGFNVFDDVDDAAAARGLERLLALVGSGRLTVPVAYRGNILDVDRIAREMLASKISGKAVLRWMGGGAAA